MTTLTRLTLPRAMIIVALVAASAAAIGIDGRATYGMRTSGDEPHYLVTAISLGEDGDLDVSDEIEGGRYRPFHEPGLAPQAAVRPDGSMVVPHDPLLPAVLALPMRWGGFRAAKATLALLAGALAALVTWTMVRRFETPVAVALATTVVFTAAAPLAVYGHQVYPELPAALALTAAVAALTGRLERGAKVAFVVSVVALPWLAVKYVPIAAVVASIGLVRLWRRGERGTAAGIGGALLVASIGYLLAHLDWYGGVTVYASGDFFQEQGGQVTVVGTDPDLLGRSRRLIGLLVGRSFGIAAWQPAWLLGVPALAALVRRRPSGWLELTLPWGVGWLTATFVALTMHGWWFPGRQLVVVLPLLTIAIGVWVARSGLRLAVLAGTGLAGVASYVWLAVEAARGDLTWIVDFASTSNLWYRTWRMALPDYLDPDASMWILHTAWGLVLAALAVWGWRSAGGPGGCLCRLGGRLGRRSGTATRTRPGAAPGAGAGTRSGDGPASVQLANRGTVVGTARHEGEREGQGASGGRAADGGASHEEPLGR